MKKLLYIFLTVLIVACSGEDGDNDENNNNQSSCPIYLDSNGVTIKACDDANVGDTGVIDGVTYTVVDEATLREMVNNEEDVTKVVTTKVTDMSNMFFLGFNNDDSIIYNDFNQDISSWDVSNVTDMGRMFSGTSFNQPIGDWDVSSVTVMRFMFSGASSFNKDLSSWSVDGVIDCYNFSNGATSWTLPQPNFTNCTP